MAIPGPLEKTASLSRVIVSVNIMLCRIGHERNQLQFGHYAPDIDVGNLQVFH